jgi:hypothetical protein
MPLTAQQAVAESSMRYWKQTESTRVIKAQHIYDWIYNNEDKIKEYIRTNMKAMFSPETIAKINIRVFNIVPKVTGKLAFAYKESPIRILDGGVTEKQNEQGTIESIQSQDDLRYQEMLKKSTIEKKQNEWDELCTPFNCVLVQPIWKEEDGKGYIDFLIHTPAWCVVETSKGDWLKPQAYYYAVWMQLKEGQPEEQVIIYWSKTEHKVLDRLENKVIIPDNPEGKNPYGILPVAILRLKDGIDFWGEGWWDIVDGNEEICEQVSNLYYTAKFQSHGQLVGINIGQSATGEGTPKTGPDKVILIGDGARSDEATPDLKFINANPIIAEVQGLIDWALSSIQKLKGLSPQQYQAEVSKISGIAKSIDNTEIEEIRKNKTNVMRMFETDLFEVIKVVYNYHNPSNKISDKAVFSIKFPEPKIMESQTDKNARREFGLGKNIMSRVDMILEDNPGMSREKAQEKFNQIVAENRKIKDEFGIEDLMNTDVSNNQPNNKQVPEGTGELQ